MTELKEWLAEVLPTKWSRRLAALTLATAVLAYGLPSYLPSEYLPSWPVERFLLRLVLALSTLLLGSWGVLVLVLREVQSLQSKNRVHKMIESAFVPSATAAPAPAIPKRLDPIEIEILMHLSRLKSSPATEITKSLRKPKALVDYHLNEMEERGFIYATHGAMYPSQWYIDQPGRKALVDRGLLT